MEEAYVNRDQALDARYEGKAERIPPCDVELAFEGRGYSVQSGI